MVKISGNDIWRGGEKIGYIEGHHIADHTGKKLGYFTDHHVWNMNDDKIGYIKEDYLYSEDGKTKASLEEVSQAVQDGVVPVITKCAIYMFLGG